MMKEKKRRKKNKTKRKITENINRGTKEEKVSHSFSLQYNFLMIWLFCVTLLPFKNLHASEFEVLLDNLDFPSSFSISKDLKDFVFIAEHQSGLVKKINLKTLDESVVIDLSEKISIEDWEEGLNSIVLSPNFNDDNTIFVNYSDRDSNIIISKFKLDNNNYPNEKLILKIIRETKNHSHHCGHMLFDDNNYLNICVGDLHDYESPNDLSSLFGKILRINVLNQDTYSIPSENPYVNNNKNIREEILFYGLKNPWKFSQYKNNFFIPDVGDNSWEELNIVENNNDNKSSLKSFGWPFYEGLEKTNFSSEIKNLTSDDILFPVLTYPHEFEEIVGCSITGGEVYNGNFSPDWIGTYIFSDLCSGKIWGLKKIKGEYKIQEIYDLDVQPVFIGSSTDNEILILTLNGELLELNLPNFNNDFLNPSFYFLKTIKGNTKKMISNRIINFVEKYENSTSYKIGNYIVNILKFFKIDKLFG